MLEQISRAKSAGAHGIVTGDLSLDRTRDLIAAARPLPVTFHRAFDVFPDRSEALERLISLGVDRVLTSGAPRRRRRRPADPPARHSGQKADRDPAGWRDRRPQRRSAREGDGRPGSALQREGRGEGTRGGAGPRPTPKLGRAIHQRERLARALSGRCTLSSSGIAPGPTTPLCLDVLPSLSGDFLHRR